MEDAYLVPDSVVDTFTRTRSGAATTSTFGHDDSVPHILSQQAYDFTPSPAPPDEAAARSLRSLALPTLNIPSPLLLATEGGLLLLALKQNNLFNMYSIAAVALSYVIYKKESTQIPK